MKGASLWKRILNEGIYFDRSVMMKHCPLLRPEVSQDRMDAIVLDIIRSPIIVCQQDHDENNPLTKDFKTDSGLRSFDGIAIPFPKFYMELISEDSKRVGIFVSSETMPSGKTRVNGLHVCPGVSGRIESGTWFSFILNLHGTVEANKPDEQFKKWDVDISVPADPKDRTAKEEADYQNAIRAMEEFMKTPEQAAVLLDAMSGCMAGPLVSALQIMSCKNVGLTPHDIDPLQAKRAAKRCGGDPNKYRYHTLIIRKPGAKSDSPGQDIGIMPRHCVRGHFAEYGPEFNKGLLFGKYSGRFYIPNFVRGDKKNGIVEKDYEVRSQLAEASS